MTSIKRILIVIIVVSFVYLIVSILTTYNVNHKQNSILGHQQQPKIKTEYETIFREDANVKYPRDNKDDDLDTRWSSDEKLQVESKKLKIPYRVVHLDLKGAPVKLNYYQKLFPQIREAGGNALLIEYEDIFPFISYKHKNAYSRSEVKKLLKIAKENDLEVIPLIQTFGHLEFVLKLEKFANLREVPEYPQEICPSKNASFHLVQDMIDQVMSIHKGINYMHIGCDEVYHIGECDKCKTKEVKNLFLDHVMRVSKFLRDKYHVTSIIWDDMLRKFYTEDLIKSKIGESVELMVWDYTEEVDHLVNPYLWPMYTSVFPNIWIASAFKGAFGESLFQVQIQRHALNHLSWLKILHREKSKILNFRGIALTGWSRYDHFSVLCELLPISVPSMILSLLILEKGTLTSAVQQLGKSLKCDVDRNFLKLDQCQWQGKDLFDAVAQLAFITEQSSSLILTHRKEKGWLSGYQLKKNYTSPWRLQEPLQQARQFIESLKSFESVIKSTLARYYDDYVIDEWIQERITPHFNDLQLFVKDIKSVTSRRFWPTRPTL